MPEVNSPILDLLIALGLIYALLSILVSIVIERWNFAKKTRSKHLKASILKLLNDPLNQDYGNLFFDHPLIQTIKPSEKKDANYISGDTFTDALIDVIAKQAVHDQRIIIPERGENNDPQAQQKNYQLLNGQNPEELEVMDQLKIALQRMNESPFRDLILSFYQKAEGKYENLKKITNTWYNDYMDRVSGWYKINQRKKYIIAGFSIAILLNVDSLHIIKALSIDESLRTSLVKSAEKVVDQTKDVDSSYSNEIYTNIIHLVDSTLAKDSNGNSIQYNSKSHEKFVSKFDSIFNKLKGKQLEKAEKSRDDIVGNIASLNIPIGWSFKSAPFSWVCDHDTVMKDFNSKSENEILKYLYERNDSPGRWGVFKYILGILISGFALSFGAPFWFELLVKLVNIRKAGIKPDTKK